VRTLVERYEVGYLSHMTLLTSVPWMAAAGLILLGLGMLVAEPRRSLGGLLSSPTSGGYIARRVIPFTVLMPLIAGALGFAGESAHLYSGQVRWMLSVVLTLLSFCWFTCLIARRLDALDRSRLALAEQRAYVVYALAHDLKVPVIGAERALELLLSGALGELAQKQRDMIHRLADSAKDQLQMIDNLVYEYRSEQGKEPLVLAVCSLPDLIDDCLEKLGPALRSKGIEIAVERQTQGMLNAVDPIAIRRVVNNLLHNAMKFTPAGGRVEISSGMVGGEFSFALFNSGHSVGERDSKNIFDRFWQSEEGRRLSTGNGLGLYICRQIVEAHRGRISCASEPGQGTTFTVVLPAAGGAAP